MGVYGYPLLIEKYKEDIERVIRKNKTVIIKGPTGCGKSTFIPLLYKDSRMAIIEPRRIAVTSLYTTLAPQIPALGYKMRFDRHAGPQTRTIIFTDGSFLNEMEMLDYDYIIIDEVHERSIRTDAILALLKKTYRNKLILMSASTDTEELERYFNAVTYEIPGSSNPLEIKYLEKPTSDYLVEAYLIIKKILSNRNSYEKKDILVFLPGEEDINELCQMCNKIPSITVLKVHSSMADKDQRKIYDESNLTRVILSTNICETSLTIPNVKYVIDSGLCKTKIYDGINHLGICPTSRDSAIQRAGRCNRLGPGVCYRLYSEFEILSKQIPEICRTDLSTIFLQIIQLGNNILTFPFINYPSIYNCKSALMFLLSKRCIECLYRGRLINSFDTITNSESILLENGKKFLDYSKVLSGLTFKTTPYGRRIVRHPFDVHLGHFYDQCIEANLGYYASLLLSLISQENYTFMGTEPKDSPDIIYLVYLLKGYMETDNKARFCSKYGVPFKGMEIACRTFKTLNKSKDGGFEKFEKIFSDSFSHNLCVRDKDGSFTMTRNNLRVFIHPSSAFFKRKDKKIVLVDVFCTTKVYARIVGKYIEK